MEKKIIVLGAIGETARNNRDTMRVISRGGIAFTLRAHISMDKPMVVRRWIKDKE